MAGGMTTSEISRNPAGGIMRRVDENELRVAVEMAVANASTHKNQPEFRNQLVGSLFNCFRRFELWREEELHERAVLPLPLFPLDEMHMRGWRQPQVRQVIK